MNNTLLEKAYNCYMYFVTNVLYGRTNQDYSTLYGATLLLANNINDKGLRECLENQLICPVIYNLQIIEESGKLILWTLNSSALVNDSFIWNEIIADTDTNYIFSTNSQNGFNFLYISIPNSKDMHIYNAANILLFDSSRTSSTVDQLFHLVGTNITSNGNTNNIFRKNDVYNTHNPVTFRIELF